MAFCRAVFLRKMNYNSLSATAVSFIPTLLLAMYIYSKDRVEKEPLGLLGLLFAVGAISYLPIHYLTELISYWISLAFASYRSVDVTGLASYTSGTAEFLSNFTNSFLGIALVEEAVIWLALWLTTSKNKNFDCLFDGIVYAVFVEMGFAVVENIRFGIVGSWDMVLRYAVITVPAHLFFGVIMGICYTKWFVTSKSRNSKKKRFWVFLSIFIPTVVHGVYCLLSGMEDSEIPYYIYIAVVYVSCFVIVGISSKKDAAIDTLIDSADGGKTNG